MSGREQPFLIRLLAGAPSSYLSNCNLTAHKDHLCHIDSGPIARSDARADGRGFNPRVRQHYFLAIGHEIISKGILSLPLIELGQFSVTGKMMWS